MENPGWSGTHRLQPKVQPSTRETASWAIHLFCNCPECKQLTDLLDYADFWDGGRAFEIGEHDTENTKAVEVVCPECMHEYEIDLQD